MPDPLLLAIDQGSSATKAVLVDAGGDVVTRAVAPVAEAHPRAGWVEQSAEDIWDSVHDAVGRCVRLEDAGRVAAVGLSNQRESVLLWERATGRPIGPLLSWQDQRTADLCRGLAEPVTARMVRTVSGLPLDSMFSAAKARWLLDQYDPDRRHSTRGEWCLGTVDSWLLARLGGEHLMEIGNASRTQLVDVARQEFSPELLELFAVPRELLPSITPSAGPLTTVAGLPPLPDGVPVGAVLADSHAALFARAGWRVGRVKATYGTGSSVMGVATNAEADVADGLCRTIAWQVDDVAYAVEGNIRSTGATLTWLASVLGGTPEEVADLAGMADHEGVYVVPAFNGLGAPWWDAHASGTITGLSLSSGPAQVARAALESIVFQVEDVVAAMEARLGRVETVAVDGGPTHNPVLMQLQADISGRVVERSETSELSALGAAHLAGLAVGVWSWEDLETLVCPGVAYQPKEPADRRTARLAGWHAAVRRARGQQCTALPADDPTGHDAV